MYPHRCPSARGRRKTGAKFTHSVRVRAGFGYHAAVTSSNLQGNRMDLILELGLVRVGRDAQQAPNLGARLHLGHVEHQRRAHEGANRALLLERVEHQQDGPCDHLAVLAKRLHAAHTVPLYN